MAFDQTKPVANSTLASADIRNNLQHLKNAISKEHNWSDTDPNGTTHKLEAMGITVTASTQGSIGTGGALANTYYNYSNGVTILNQQTGVAAGTYTLKSLVQELVNRSHVHSTSGIYVNCNCCNCGGS